MSSLRVLGLVAFVVALPSYAVPAMAKAEMHRSVAIVYSLSGEASITTTGGASRPVRLLDHLPSGTTVTVGPSSRLAMAFMNGLRYELGERSRVTLGPKDLTARTGPVRGISRLPPLPCLLPIAAKDRPGPRAGAVRIRGESITGLDPRDGVIVLADGVVLRFQPVAGAKEYRIEIQDPEGRTAYSAGIESPPLNVPGEKLRAGASYLWRVRTAGRPGAVARGEAEFVTLNEAAAKAREEAREVLMGEGPDSLPLLAEIDRSLGLLLKAREDLETALVNNPGNPAIQEALAAIDARLEQENDPE